MNTRLEINRSEGVRQSLPSIRTYSNSQPLSSSYPKKGLKRILQGYSPSSKLNEKQSLP